MDKDESLLLEGRRYYAGVCIYDLNENRLPFNDRVFDAIFAKDVLEHLRSPWEIVGEMHRILCHGGIALAQVPMAKAKVVWNDYTHIRGFTKNSAKKVFEDSGFEVISIRKMGGIPLAGRFDLAGFIPMLLKIPLFDYLFGSSHLIKVRKTD